MSIVLGLIFTLIGIIVLCVGTRYVLVSIKEEAKEDGPSQWPDNFFNYFFFGAGLVLFLVGLCMFANVDLRVVSAMFIVILVVGILSLLSIIIFAVYKAVPIFGKLKKQFKDWRKNVRYARYREFLDMQAQQDAEQQITQPTTTSAQDRPLHFPAPQRFAPATETATQSQFQPSQSMQGQNNPQPQSAAPIEDDVDTLKVMLAPRRVPDRKSSAKRSSGTRKQPAKKPATKKSSTLSTK